MKLGKLIRREEGSATIELLGIIPVAILLLLIVWQFVLGVNAVVVTHSAINEYASVYSITKSCSEASTAFQEIIDSINNVTVAELENPCDTEPDQKNFTAKTTVDIQINILPSRVNNAIHFSVPYEAEAYGRVIE